MSTRRPAEAAQSYIDSRQLILSCVSTAVLTTKNGYHVSRNPHVLTLNNGAPIALRGDLSIDLLLTENYVIEASSERATEWVVRRTAYWYTLQSHEHIGEPIREIVSYHWHPHVPDSVDYPHLHLGSGAGTLIRPLTKAHLPTGQVSIESILRLAIEEARSFLAVPTGKPFCN